MKSSFPNEAYLKNLIVSLRKRVDDLELDEQILVYAGVHLNWIGDVISDSTVQWSLEDIPVTDLYLTGTNQQWNKIILDQAEGSPKKLKMLMINDPTIAIVFHDITITAEPILVVHYKEKYRVFDGMHRVVAAIRDDKLTIKAYVAELTAITQPFCEPHVVYDLLRSYQRKINTDREGLISALRFLRKSYANVNWLLENRFNKEHVRDDEIQEIIKESLQ